MQTKIVTIDLTLKTLQKQNQSFWDVFLLLFCMPEMQEESLQIIDDFYQLFELYFLL